jgi:hypothetical protein
MNRPRRYLLHCILLGLLSLPLTACALSGGPIEGQVLEEGANQPIAGAIVVARWNGTAFSFVESPTVCVHVLTTTTDAEGKYRLPAWRKESPIKGVRDIHPTVTAHKAGYELARRYQVNNPLLTPFTGTRAERLEYLLRVSSATRCGESGASEKNLLPLKKSLYEEAKSIAKTAEDQNKVETLLFGLESLEFGSIEALNRMTERHKVKK